MPKYDYQCESCGKTFEVEHAMSAAGPDKCPKCGTRGTVHRLLSAGSGLIFKGSGFYITDYARKNGGNPSSSGSSGGNGSGGNGSGKSATEKSAESKASDTASAKAPEKTAAPAAAPAGASSGS